MKVSLKKIGLNFDDWKMSDFSLSINSGEFVSIVGPSGCGKTTLLRIIAGLQQHKGKIFFSENEVTFTPPHERKTGFVFQENSLFPHMNVFDNVAFGLKMQGKFSKEKVLDALDIVNLTGFEKRSVEELSSGEKKRVAIARSIAPGPKILLLDEPFSSLDAPLKEKMKKFVDSLRKKLGITIVMVTHDIDEAFFLSDRIIVMSEGRIEQDDIPSKIFLSPRTKFVKDFVSDYLLLQASGKKKLVLSLPKELRDGNYFFALKKTNYRKE